MIHCWSSCSCNAKSICLSPCRRALGSVGVSIRKLGQSLESEGHPRHVWDGAIQGSLWSTHPSSLTFALLPFVIIFSSSSSSLMPRPCPTFKCSAEIKNTTLCALPHLKLIHFMWICFKAGHVFKNFFPLSDTDSLPGSVPGPVPAACEGGGWGNDQKRLLSELVSGELLGRPH